MLGLVGGMATREGWSRAGHVIPFLSALYILWFEIAFDPWWLWVPVALLSIPSFLMLAYYQLAAPAIRKNLSELTTAVFDWPPDLKAMLAPFPLPGVALGSAIGHHVFFGFMLWLAFAQGLYFLLAVQLGYGAYAGCATLVMRSLNRRGALFPSE